MRHKDAEQGMGLSLAGRADADLRLAASVFANSYEGIVPIRTISSST
jgi:hypothetical protein